MKDIDIHGEHNVWSTAQRQKNIYGFDVHAWFEFELAMANSVRLYGYVLRREGGHTLRRSLDFEVDNLRKNGGPKSTWKGLVEEESMKVGL